MFSCPIRLDHPRDQESSSIGLHITPSLQRETTRTRRILVSRQLVYLRAGNDMLSIFRLCSCSMDSQEAPGPVASLPIDWDSHAPASRKSQVVLMLITRQHAASSLTVPPSKRGSQAKAPPLRQKTRIDCLGTCWRASPASFVGIILFGTNRHSLPSLAGW